MSYDLLLALALEAHYQLWRVRASPWDYPALNRQVWFTRYVQRNRLTN